MKKMWAAYQSEKTEHGQAVVRSTGPAAGELVQAVGKDSLHQLPAGLHTGK